MKVQQKIRGDQYHPQNYPSAYFVLLFFEQVEWIVEVLVVDRYRYDLNVAVFDF